VTLEFSSKAKKPKSFKDHELFSQLKIPPGVFFVIRCDGRSFKEVCSKVGFKKPFDKAFAELMVSSSKAVFEGGLNPLFTFIHSDEASFLFNLKGLKAPQLHELVFKEAGVNLATTPPWQRRGIALIWEEEVKEGFDPVKGAKVKALRLQLKEDWSPPIFASSEGRGYIERSMEARLRGVTRP